METNEIGPWEFDQAPKRRPRFEWRHQYDETADELAGDTAALTTPAATSTEPSLAQQQFTADTDLNEIMRRYGVTDRAIPPAQFPAGAFEVDLTELADMEFRDVFDRVRQAEQMFGQLPADLRARFDNQPERMLQWVNDPTNTEEAISLGFLKRSSSPTSVSRGADSNTTAARSGKSTSDTAPAAAAQ